ncbi:DUF2510 domain-containing protein [Agrococcus jejuensis]|uniref:DUF2510 domain-containing protein n=1 Tax=Agrococcus jejuensis TaxID=399736 RepID=A0A1G8EK57_9MICO|nr:DUF2510 domain-containing protein [Agrococcus jejuensis]SDH70172.1 Protein of unknown function [Agrococcus jejuensis]
MPSFLIVHSQPPGGRADLFAQPPMLDVSGLGARLDWGDTTFEVPPGDHRVTISVAPVAGGHEGAVVTVRVLPETGTRISFAPPAVAGQPSTLRVDGQWPADAAMAYYAARDQRPLAPIAQQQVGGQPAGAPAWGGPQSYATNPVQRLPQASAPGSAPVQQSAPQPTPTSPTPTVPPVGPSIGSTGSVPIVAPPSSAPTFGQMQGAVVEPGAQHPLPPAPPPIVAPVAAPAWSQQPSGFAPPAQQAPVPQAPVAHPSQPAAAAQPPRVAPPQVAPQPSAQQQAAPPVVPMQPPVQHAQPPRVAPQQVAPQQQAPQHVVPPHVAAPQQPGHVAPPAFGPGAPQHPPMQPGAQPAFGHQPIVRRDIYGRDRVDGDRSAPAIPTPRQFEDFARAERERHEAEAVAASRQQQGWYPDPYGRSEVRWHDGERWTASVMRGGRREHDPV